MTRRTSLSMHSDDFVRYVILTHQYHRSQGSSAGPRQNQQTSVVHPQCQRQRQSWGITPPILGMIPETMSMAVLSSCSYSRRTTRTSRSFCEYWQMHRARESVAQREGPGVGSYDRKWPDSLISVTSLDDNTYITAYLLR
jgi:hypothetical protein